jgi:hypothetical protein
MRRTPLLIIAFVFLCGFRAPNGEIISDGDPADKLLLNLGNPLIKTNIGIVRQGNLYVTREVWTYQIGDITYRFTIEGGTIVSDEWTRMK